MKLRNGMKIFISCIAIMISTGVFAQSEQQLVVPLSDPGKPWSLDVDIMSGSIKVSSYTGKDVIINVALRNHASKNEDDEKTSGGMKRISSGGGYEIVAEEKNNNVEVHNQSFTKTVDLTLQIPQNVKLKLHTVNGGDIEVENVKGELEVDNVNGAIKLMNVSGYAVASTVNGGIKANFLSVDTKASIAFSTLTGNIDVT